MNRYVVSGEFWAGREYQDFETEIEADSEDLAIERTYANFGSRHGVKRTQLQIDEVTEA